MTHRDLIERDLFAAAQKYRDSGTLRPWGEFWAANKKNVERLKLSKCDFRRLHERLMDVVLGVKVR